MHTRPFKSSPLDDASIESLAGTFLDDRHYDQVIREDCRIDKPDGTPLLVFRRNALPYDVCAAAYPALRVAARPTDNRGFAGGSIEHGADLEGVRRPDRATYETRVTHREIKSDGTVSATKRTKLVRSGIVGYFERRPRHPYCRMTAYNLHHPEKFAAALPFIRSVNAVFARDVPDRYAVQFDHIRRTHPDFFISQTAFTTITVNRNFRTACHKDAGDLKAGFGVMTVLQAGQYTGGYLIFPKYRVAVDMRSRDVLLADVHEYHGNGPIAGVGRYERISCVMYFREAMTKCGSAADELARAKARKG